MTYQDCRDYLAGLCNCENDAQCKYVRPHDPCFDEPYKPYEASADGWKALDSRG